VTFTQFTIYVIEYDRQHHKERSGQAAFNALWNVRPELADEIRGTDLDPFYDDKRLLAFWEHLSAVWAS
jgi:hypothetical protein